MSKFTYFFRLLLLYPTVGQFWKTVKEKNAGPVFGLETGLQYVNHQTIDISHKARTYVLVKGKWDRRDISANIIDYKHLHTQGSHWHFGHTLLQLHP